MKILLIAVTMIAASTCVHAQNYGFDLYLSGGTVVPDAPHTYAQGWQAGPHIGTGFEFTLSQRVSVGAGFGYMRNSMKNGQFLDGTTGTSARASGGVLDMYAGFVFVNYRLFGQVANMFPYLSVDGGIAHEHISGQTVSYLPELGLPDRMIPGMSETAFRAAWGAGIDVPLSTNIAFTCSGKYVYVFTQGGKKAYVPIDGGFKFVF